MPFVRVSIAKRKQNASVNNTKTEGTNAKNALPPDGLLSSSFFGDEVSGYIGSVTIWDTWENMQAGHIVLHGRWAGHLHALVEQDPQVYIFQTP